jgi:tetrahydromethanopterin S-methyltransferase subunit D
MTLTLTVAIGLAAGLHGALYGAYKDSPHESFRMPRFLREVAFALALSVGLFMLVPEAAEETAFIRYLSVFALTRIVTEFWKLFVRVEPQEGFRIPTQIHWVTGVVHHPLLRLLLGLGFLASIYGIWALCTLIPDDVSNPVRGLVAGLAIGTAEAIAGAYKDGTIEGFHWLKFFKSPAFGVIGGVVAAGHTSNDAFLILGAIGTMRMLLELLFKMLPRDYTPGKFPSLVGRYTKWLELRRHFLTPYALTWLLYMILSSHPEW